MTSDPTSCPGKAPVKPRGGWLRILAVAFGLAWLAVILIILFAGRAPDSTADQTSDSISNEPEGVTFSRTATPVRTGHGAAVAGAAHAAIPRTVFPEPSVLSRRIVDKLVNFDKQPEGAPLTDEQAAAWKERLQELIHQGSSSVSAIHEFLLKNVDVDFVGSGKQIFGYNTIREAMFDALKQIGGPLAIASLSETLADTADPREIAILAQYLEGLEPNQHRAEALDAARQSLTMAATGALQGKDTAPLFDVLAKCGDANAVTDLRQNAERWNYYSVLALGQLPDGSGLPALIDIASGRENPNSTARSTALQVLAQLAPESEEAQTAFTESVRKYELTCYDWAVLALPLSGNHMFFQNTPSDTYLATANQGDIRSVYIPSSNQHIAYAPVGVTTPDQIKKQLDWLHGLMEETREPCAIQALQKAEQWVLSRAPQMASADPLAPSSH